MKIIINFYNYLVMLRKYMNKNKIFQCLEKCFLILQKDNITTGVQRLV